MQSIVLMQKHETTSSSLLPFVATREALHPAQTRNPLKHFLSEACKMDDVATMMMMMMVMAAATLMAAVIQLPRKVMIRA